jgi:hypothetical protein
MKRFNFAALLAATTFLGATGSAWADKLLPTDPNGPYAKALGNVNVTYKSLWQKDSWGNRYKAEYFDLNYKFSGLAADPVNGTNYLLIAYVSNGASYTLALVGTLDGTATDTQSWWDGWYVGTFVYYELWLAERVQDSTGLYHWLPVGTAPVLSSQ